ncbi:MAG: gamma-glutamyltransferase [Myxococcota bacterium]
MVSTDAVLATKVGVQTLAAGGNAVDAAVAVAFALAVVFPEAGNIGGGGFMVYRRNDGETAALDFRETAPAAASRDMYIDPATGRPTKRSRNGALAAGVPGTVAGLWAAHQKYGQREWSSLIEPAIRMAEDGFIVDEALAIAVARQRKRLFREPSSKAVFFADGRSPQVGDTMRNPALAATLKRIAKDGPPGFYEGRTAELIVAQMKRSKGIITAQDLANYRPKFRRPVRMMYRGHEVIGMPPPSSGGLVFALMTRVLEKIDVRALGWHSAAHVHRVAETMRHAFARRNTYLGDSDFVKVPTERFDSDKAAQEILAAFDSQRATPSTSVLAQANPGQGKHTTNFAIVDKDDNAVALTYTLNTSFGSGLVVKGAGFLLNNEMDDFAAAPGKPNAYGLVQGEANAIAPGKRPLSSMSPTIVLDPQKRVLLVTGAAGGPTIITATFQIMSAVVDFKMGIQTAVNESRFHHQHLPDRLFIEPGALSPEVIQTLTEMGHQVADPPFPIGDAPTLGRSPNGWMGGVEPRQQGALAAGP